MPSEAQHFDESLSSALLHAQNRIRVLEDEIAHAHELKRTSVEASVSSTFKLEARHTAAHDVELRIRTASLVTQWLCDSSLATHIFHFLLTTADGSALSAGLLSACPRRDSEVTFSIPASVLSQWQEHVDAARGASSDTLKLYRPLAGRRTFIVPRCYIASSGSVTTGPSGSGKHGGGNSGNVKRARNAPTHGAKRRAAPSPVMPYLRKRFYDAFGRRLDTQRPWYGQRSSSSSLSSSSRLPPPVPSRYLPPLPAGRLPLRVCARVEAFNVYWPDLQRTANFSLLGSSDGKPRLGRAHGCSRISIIAANMQPPIGCFDIGAVPAAAAHKKSDATRMLFRPARAAQNGVFGEVAIAPPAARVISSSKTQNGHGRGRSAWSPAWVRVIGDSVTRGLLATNAMATAMCLPEGIMRLVDYGPIDPRRPKGPKWELSCNKQPRETKDRWCISYEPHYDLPAADYRTPEPAERLVAGVGNATSASVGLRTLTYLSLGSHSKNLIGSDATAEARFFRWFDAFLRRQVELGSRVVLALETPRANYAAPSAFKGLGTDCLLSNMRIALRNRAAARAFTRACEGRGAGARCAVLDLFASVLPYVFDNATFKRGDPVHPRADRQAAWFLAPARQAFDDVMRGL